MAVVIDTFTPPTDDERRLHHSARVAHFALRLRAQIVAGHTTFHPHIGMCVTCGEPTGNFCDPCVDAGYTFTVPSGQVMAGSPRCTVCDGPGGVCLVCTGEVPPLGVGAPTYSIQAVPDEYAADVMWM